MLIDETIINFDVYEDAVEYLGMASVRMPEITNAVNNVSGAGISGTIESVVLGHIDAMTMTMNFRTLTPASVRLAEPRQHNLDLRVAQQNQDSTSGQIVVSSIKYVVIATPKKLNPGNIAPASAADASGEYAVAYLAAYIDGVKVLEVDPRNYIYFVNGRDYLVDVRKALGK